MPDQGVPRELRLRGKRVRRMFTAHVKGDTTGQLELEAYFQAMPHFPPDADLLIDDRYGFTERVHRDEGEPVLSGIIKIYELVPEDSDV